MDDHRFAQTQFGTDLALGPVAQLRVDQIGEPRHPGDGPEPADRTRELLVARLGEVRTVEFYEEDTRLALPAARCDVRVTRSEGDASAYRVEVTARTLLRDLALFPDRLDPAVEVDEMLVTLLPGESTVFRVTGAVIEDPGALGTRPVLRCVNDTIA